MNSNLLSPTVVLSCLSLTLASVCPAQVVLEGDFLRVGVNNNGTLIDSSFTAGIGVREANDGAWVADGPDIISPGRGFEFFALGHSGGQASTNYFKSDENDLSTANTSTGTLLQAITTGNLGGLQFTQTLSFETDSSIIRFSVKLLNTGDAALSDVFYARGLDANPDYIFGLNLAAETNNVVENGVVTTWGPETGWALSIVSDANGNFVHTPSIRSDWTNVYTDTFDFSSLLGPGNAGHGDHSINMAWNIGALAPGAEASLDFEYRIHRISAANVPDGGSTFAMFGMALAGLTFTGLRRRWNSFSA